MKHEIMLAVTLVGQLVADVSMWRFSVKLRPVCVGFVVKWYWDRLYLSPAVFPYHYHCTSAPYSFVHLLPLLYHVGK